MSEEINEPVEVLAKFARGHLTPRLFSWRNRDYQVERVDFVYFQHLGESKIYSFSLTCKGTNYLLVFNSLDFNWRLKRVETS